MKNAIPRTPSKRANHPQVRKAKEAHLLAYEQAAKLATAKAQPRKEGEPAEPAWYELRKRIQQAPPVVQLLYRPDGPVGYKGKPAPIGKDGRVVDTDEVERARAEHRRAHEQAEAIAKRHPPQPEDNTV